MPELSNYYADQLKKIEPAKIGTFPARVKVEHETGDTKWLSLNDDSAKALITFLQENYNV